MIEVIRMTADGGSQLDTELSPEERAMLGIPSEMPNNGRLMTPAEFAASLSLQIIDMESVPEEPIS